MQHPRIFGWGHIGREWTNICSIKLTFTNIRSVCPNGLGLIVQQRIVSETHRLRDASTKGRIVIGTQHSRKALSKGLKIPRWNGQGHTVLFGDKSSRQPNKYLQVNSVRTWSSTLPPYCILIEDRTWIRYLWFYCAFFNVSSTAWARIFKLLRSSRIDSKEQIPPDCVAWRSITTTLFLLGS